EGIGFVFTEDDPYAGIDLDDCRNPETGVIAPWARRIIAVLSSYTEISPSGTGVHIYVQGRLPGQGRNLKPVEIYDRRHYFTVTGQHIPGTSTTIEEQQDVLDLLYVAAPIMVKLLGSVNKHEKFERLFTGDISQY